MTLAAAARAVLAAADPAEKVALTRDAACAWREGNIRAVGECDPPLRPGRPSQPELRLPRDMPKRRAGGSRATRVALLHALAHIELNAIDLAWDAIARFRALPRAFYDDWLRVAAEEAEHHALIAARLAELGAAYGDLPAHDGLWEAAEETRHDILARLAIVPLVLEARGLDVTPDMIRRLHDFGDAASAAVLERIYDDEIGHVAAGMRWFRWEAARRGLEPAAAWRELVGRHFRGRLKPPFNGAARAAAGFPPEFYSAALGSASGA
jgi:uncharacterized ferritin-like protein (DUF455 family)